MYNGACAVGAESADCSSESAGSTKRGNGTKVVLITNNSLFCIKGNNTLDVICEY